MCMFEIYYFLKLRVQIFNMIILYLQIVLHFLYRIYLKYNYQTMDQISIADRMLQQLQLEYIQVHSHNLPTSISHNQFGNQTNQDDLKKEQAYQLQQQAQQQNLEGYQPLHQDNFGHYSSSEDSDQEQSHCRMQDVAVLMDPQTTAKYMEQNSNDQDAPQQMRNKNPQQYNSMELIEVGPVPDSIFQVPQSQFQIQQQKIKELTKAMSIQPPTWMADQKIFRQKLQAMFTNLKK